MSDTVVVKSYSSRIEAELAVAILSAQGIPSMLVGDDAFGMYGPLTAARGVDLVVRTEDAEAAADVLDEDTELTGDVAGDSV